MFARFSDKRTNRSHQRGAQKLRWPMAPLSLNPPPVMLRTLDIKASFRICMQDYRGHVLLRKMCWRWLQKAGIMSLACVETRIVEPLCCYIETKVFLKRFLVSF